MIWIGIIAGLLLVVVIVVVHDMFQRKIVILRNFPIVGRLRYMLIKIGPELRQYLVAHNREEAPFNRLEREWIYNSADRANNYFGFGTDDEIYTIGYPIIKHSVFGNSAASTTGNVKGGKLSIPCAKEIGAAHGRRRPYQPACIFNISAMSFGSLGKKAVTTLNLGAKKVNCFHNTGEGGVSKYHRLGADICWQLGTGYFGVCSEAGKFDMDLFKKTVEEAPQIRLIEIKLSQGAKPGKGGVLPASKVTPEIAEARSVPIGKDVISPSGHSTFSSVDELIDFVEQLADVGGLPVGIKSAVGQLGFFYELADKMKKTGQGPDFITIDGGEGGTGAAPLTFADHVSLPFKLGFSRVYKIFQNQDLVDDITWIGSGKLGFPDRAIVAMAMGADLVNIAREAMLSIGCIQAQKCHTGHCPSGVCTHSKWLQRGLDIEINTNRFVGYMDAFLGEVLSVTYASGYSHPGQFTPHDIEISSGPNIFKTLYELLEYDKKQYAPNMEPCFKKPEDS